MEKKNVLWFSRHSMSAAQLQDLERGLGCSADVIQYRKAVKEVDEIIAAVDQMHAEVVAATLPLHMLGELLDKLPESVPVIVPKTGRKSIKNPETEEIETEYVHLGWIRYREVQIITEPWYDSYALDQ